MLLTSFAEHIQYHQAKNEYAQLKLSKMELQLERVNEYIDNIKKVTEKALIQLSSENTKLKGDLL